MTKRRAPAFILFFTLAAGALAAETSPIDLTALNADIATLFSSIGQDLSPRLHQIAMSGNDLVGEARLRGLTRFSLSLAGVSLSTIDGVAKVMDSTDPDLWKFSLISIPTLVKDSLTDPTAQDAFSMVTGGVVPWPAIRVGLGLPLPGNLEILGNGFYMSKALVDMGLSLTGISLPAGLDLDAMGADLQMLTIGAMLRKPILSDKRGFFRPSLSLGASYTYSKFDFTVDDFTLDALGMDPIAMEGMGKLTMAGKTGFHTQIHSLGAVLHVSKTILWALTPFAKFGAYYHISDYSSEFNVTATVTPDDPAASAINQELDAPVSIHSEDVSFIASTGLEVKLLPITITVCGSLDLERPVVEIPSIDLGSLDTIPLDEFKLNGLGLTAAIRIQI
jgi:hypothetical protein